MTQYEKAVALWQQKNIKNDAELAEALNGHSITFAYHSGKIENDRITYHDTREIFEHDGVTSYTGDLRTLFEIRNAKEANELFLASFGARRPLDARLICEFQKKLTQNTCDTRRYQLGEKAGNLQAARLRDGPRGNRRFGRGRCGRNERAAFGTLGYSR